jgi:hypothetical protein
MAAEPSPPIAVGHGTRREMPGKKRSAEFGRNNYPFFGSVPPPLNEKNTTRR